LTAFNKAIGLIVLCAVVALAPACSRDRHAPGGRLSSKDSTAVDFVLNDITGRQVRLSSYKGQVVLLEFWATWCPPCRATIPELAALQDKYRSKGLVVLGVSVDEGQGIADKLSAFVKENHINYTVLLGDEDISRAYGVSSIPMSILINREGKVVKVVLGGIENFQEEMSSFIDKII